MTLSAIKSLHRGAQRAASLCSATSRTRPAVRQGRPMPVALDSILRGLAAATRHVITCEHLVRLVLRYLDVSAPSLQMIGFRWRSKATASLTSRLAGHDGLWDQVCRPDAMLCFLLLIRSRTDQQHCHCPFAVRAAARPAACAVCSGPSCHALAALDVALHRCEAKIIRQWCNSIVSC